MPHIRPFRAGDEAALSDICLRTADRGADATGVFDDDDLWGAVFVLPYVERHPDLAFVVATDDDDRPLGYVVGTPDTEAFEDWFATEWWPRFADRWPRPAAESSRQDGTLVYAYDRRPGRVAHTAGYPAHLHIDLLPEAQGQGWGRRLIDRLCAELRERGVTGLHLVASADNGGALAFYDRLGMTRLPSSPGGQAFGVDLSG